MSFSSCVCAEKDSNLEQYPQWCETLKVELKEKSKINVDKRIEKVVTIVNDTLAAQSFSVRDDVKEVMIRQIETNIDAWNGVDISVCKNKQKKTFREYQGTARNWFNRNKAKIYGHHLFYDVIYTHVLKCCAEQSSMSDAQRMIAFVTMLERILSATVQFPRTKLQPLLPHQSLMQPNKFKQACEQFVLYYQVQWSVSAQTTHSSRDPDRAKKIHGAFCECLTKIREMLETAPSDAPPPPYPFILGAGTESVANDASAAIAVAFEKMEQDDIRELVDYPTDQSATTLVTAPPTVIHKYNDQYTLESPVASPPSLSSLPFLPSLPTMIPDISRIALPPIHGMNLLQPRVPSVFDTTTVADSGSYGQHFANCQQLQQINEAPVPRSLNNDVSSQSTMTMPPMPPMPFSPFEFQYEDETMAQPQLQPHQRPVSRPLHACAYGPARGVNHGLRVMRHRHCPMSNVPRTAPEWGIPYNRNGGSSALTSYDAQTQHYHNESIAHTSPPPFSHSHFPSYSHSHPLHPQPQLQHCQVCQNCQCLSQPTFVPQSQRLPMADCFERPSTPSFHDNTNANNLCLPYHWK
mmetsp:Transcript_53953/g.89382  ORF Transcript_53953/g.89382 Transcript_53953/m.89382 type:complete len:578 (+) Transcript_53953:25-1758(+)